MKPITLFLTALLFATTVNAQWKIGGQVGLNKTFYRSPETASSAILNDKLEVLPAFIGSAYILSDKERIVNLGLGVSVKRNKENRYLEARGYNGSTSSFNISHKSTYLSLHPIVDVNLDKKRHFHVLANPSLNFFVGGNENGYSRYSTGEYIGYTNNTSNIKKMALGISAQLQARYPIAKNFEVTGGVGYSINNTISKFIPGERGNVFVQVGLFYKLPKFTAKEETDKKTKDSEKQ